MKYASGYRFNPFDQELITDYLKPKIMGEQLPCNIIKFRQVYGPSSNPWHVFDPNDQHSWLVSPDIKPTEKFMFVFAKLSKLSSSCTSKNTSKKAGCGTWVGKTKRDQIRDGEGNVIGEKRYLVFEIKEIDSAVTGVGFDLSKVGYYKMHEYSLSGINEGLDSADSIVICKITYDSSKNPPINLKSGTKIADHVSRSSSEAQEEENKKNFEDTGCVTAENLTMINSVGGGENLEINSGSLVGIQSDVGDWHAAAQYNNAVQDLDNFDGGFGFDDIVGKDFCVDDFLSFDMDWVIESLDSKQKEEPVEDKTISKLGKRNFEMEDNSYHAKKICLE